MGKYARNRSVEVSELRVEELGLVRGTDTGLIETFRADEEERRIEEEAKKAHLRGSSWDYEDQIL